MIKITSSIHNHCTHCDGKNSPREMIEAAIKAGFTDFGFSSHSRIESISESWNTRDEDGYKQEVIALKTEYKDRLRIYCGLEVDYCSLPRIDKGYDYLLDSVHMLKVDGKYYGVDESAVKFESLINDAFCGDPYNATKAYYDTMSRMIEERKPKVCCHFDLVTKFNDGMKYFDESDDRYLKPLYAALDFAIKSGAIIEINYGAIARKCKSTPYPASYLLPFLKESGARLLIGSDCHNSDFINFGFSEGIDLLQANGFKTLTVYENGEYIDKPIL